MRKIQLLVLLMLLFNISKAQRIKLSLTQGIGLDPNKKNDSLFFAKNYNATQFRVGYHYGKLGLIANITNIRQNSTTEKDLNDERVPIFVKQNLRTYSDVNTLNTNLGLELCVPIYKRKAQLNIYAIYGVSFSKSDSVKFNDGVNIVSYSHKVSRKTTGCFQTGFSLNYKLNRHVAIKWQNEFNAYKLPFDAIDTRKTPAQFSGAQSKKLFISSLGVQYTF